MPASAELRVGLWQKTGEKILTSSKTVGRKAVACDQRRFPKCLVLPSPTEFLSRRLLRKSPIASAGSFRPLAKGDLGAQ
jgi:hypothetical protein